MTMLDIACSENIARESRRTAAASLEASTAAMERKLSRSGWAARSWAMGHDLSAGLGCAVLTIGFALLRVTGAL